MPTSPLQNSSGVLGVTISCDGTALSTEILVQSVEILQSINRIPRAIITIVDGDMPNATFPVSDEDTFKPGAAVKIQAGYDSNADTIFEGIIIKHGITISPSGESLLKIECKDKAIGMTIGRKNANYLDMKDSDIITKVIGNHSGLSADVDATDASHKAITQYYCTDWDFILARAEANGLWINVDAASVKVKAPKADGSATLTLTYGVDIYDFQAEVDSQYQVSSVEAVAWDLAQQKIQKDTASPAALYSQGNLDAATLAKVVGLSKQVLQTPTPVVANTLKSWAKGQQVKADLSRIRGHVRFPGSSLAKVGGLVELKGVGARFNGQVLVTSLSHSLREGEWETEIGFGMSSQWFSESQPIAAPMASGLTGGMEGLHIGVVKKLDADPESQYKIQVSVPVMQAETDGVWARIGNMYASNGFGNFFIPEVGDEVILGFFNNDPSHPVILGSLYSSKNKAPKELTAENTIKTLITKSKLTLEFDDDKKVITLTTPGKNSITISDDAKSIVLKDQNSNTVELSDKGITLNSGKDIILSAKGKLTIDAMSNVEITSKADVKVSGLNINQNAQVGMVAKGSATAEFSASGQTTIKGAMVMIN